MVDAAGSQSTDGRVVLVAGDEASGLARITGQYLEQLLSDSAEKRAQAEHLRGRLGLHAREGGVEVTLTFDGGAVVIEEGLREPDLVIAGPIDALLNLLAGRVNPALALGRRQLSLRVSARNPLFGYRAYRLMRLPNVHLWSGIPPRAAVAFGVASVAALLLLRSCRRACRGQGAG